MAALLKVSNLYKEYLGNCILNDASFALDTGNYALLGQNGVGKSTLLKILVGSLPYDSGKIIINGYDIVREALSAKRLISYVPDKADTYPFLSGNEFIALVMSLRKIDSQNEAQRYIDAFNLGIHMHKQFKDMSLGTQRKLFLVAGLMANPLLLIMDEPFNDLDNTTRDVFLEMIKLEQHRRIFLFSTHDCDLISKINAQKIILENAIVTLPKSSPS